MSIHLKQSLATIHSLFRKKKFMLDEKFQCSASKFAIFYTYENPKLPYTRAFIRGKNKVVRNDKQKKYLWVFIKYGKF